MIFPGFSANSTYLSPQGGLGGGQIGYNWQTNSFLGPLVLGVEADIQGAGMDDNRTDLFPGFQYSQKLDWFGTVRGRVGLATGPTMTYLTAGFAYGNVNTTVQKVGCRSVRRRSQRLDLGQRRRSSAWWQLDRQDRISFAGPRQQDRSAGIRRTVASQ